MEKNINKKIKSLSEIVKITKSLKRDGKIIVHCHGTFDLIHPGHIRHFNSAKKHGDILIVTVTGDKFVKKGPGRPIFTEKLRAEVLASLAAIDYVVIIQSDSAISALQKIQPHFYVKGPDNKYRKSNPLLPRKLGIEKAAVKEFGGQLVFTDDEIVFSSSHLINTYLESYPEATQDYLERLRKTYTDDQIISQLSQLKTKRVMVIGDTIIDEYHYTHPLGKSSKEPLVVHLYVNEETYAGGSLATANHLACLSDDIRLVTLLGNQNSYYNFIKKHLRDQIKTKFFYQENAPTVLDRRFLNILTKQKLFQIRYMRDQIIPQALEKKVLTYLKKQLSLVDMVVVNDFGHGFITPKIIRYICRNAKYMTLNVQTNSANFGFNIITKYPRADFICMDELELRLATHEKYLEIAYLMKKVARKLKCREIIITRGSEGSISYSPTHGIEVTPALSQNVVDRVGAGDAFFAIASLCSHINMDQRLISFIGNVAGALKVQTMGNKYALELKDVVKFITRLLK